MKARSFNSVFPIYQEKWASKVLNIPRNLGDGPDLLDNDKAVEIKFKLIYGPGKTTDKCWRVLGHQHDYNNEYKDFYWGFGFYGLSKEVKEITLRDFSNIDNLVTRRELYLIKGDWIHNFPKYHQFGKTHISEWDHYISYPRKNNLFPKTIFEEDVFGGKVVFTEGIDKNKFNINKDSFSLNKVEELEIPF